MDGDFARTEIHLILSTARLIAQTIVNPVSVACQKAMD